MTSAVVETVRKEASSPISSAGEVLDTQQEVQLTVVSYKIVRRKSFWCGSVRPKQSNESGTGEIFVGADAGDVNCVGKPRYSAEGGLDDDGG